MMTTPPSCCFGWIPPSGHPSKATTWRGRHHLNLPHHQVGTHPKQQFGGVVIISIFLTTRWAPIQSNNLEGSSSSQSSSSPGGHPSKATTWRGRHHLNLFPHQVGTHPKQQLGGVVIISIFLITRWAPIQSNNLEGSSSSQSFSS